MAGMQISEWFKSTLVDWDERFLASLPLFHVFAAVGVQGVAFVGAPPWCWCPIRAISPTWWRPSRRRGPRSCRRADLLPGAPEQRAGENGKTSLKSIKLCISGAAPLLQETKERFEKATGGRIVEGYALTESMMAACITPVQGKYKVGSWACRSATCRCASWTPTPRNGTCRWVRSARLRSLRRS